MAEMFFHVAEFKRVTMKAARCFSAVMLAVFFVWALALPWPLFAQEPGSNWQMQVRKYCEASDWPSAMRVVEAETSTWWRDCTGFC
jgi:hypothetical protein